MEFGFNRLTPTAGPKRRNFVIRLNKKNDMEVENWSQ